jgi:outer membrane protein
MTPPHKPLRLAALVAFALAAAATAPAALADGTTDIGYVDEGALAALPAFVSANRQLQQYGANLQQQYIGRARGASQSQQQQLAAQFQQQMGSKQRELLAPLFGKAQVAIASVASSRNLSVVVDKRIVIVGGQDITGSVRDLLTGAGDPVPPVSTPPPSTVGYVDQQQIDATPAIKSAAGDFAKFKADEDRQTAQKLRGAKNDADRSAILKDYQSTLEAKQKSILQPLIDKTKNAMADVAHKKNLVLVVDRTNVVYGGTDITSDVTAELK